MRAAHTKEIDFFNLIIIKGDKKMASFCDRHLFNIRKVPLLFVDKRLRNFKTVLKYYSKWVQTQPEELK